MGYQIWRRSRENVLFMVTTLISYSRNELFSCTSFPKEHSSKNIENPKHANLYVIYYTGSSLHYSELTSVFLLSIKSLVFLSMFFYLFTVQSKTSYKCEELNTVVRLLMNIIYTSTSLYDGESQWLVPSLWNKQQFDISTVLLYCRISLPFNHKKSF